MQARYTLFVMRPFQHGLVVERIWLKVSEITQDLVDRVDYPLDGMVAEVTQAKVKNHMGATNHHHRWQIAIKAEGEVKETKVLDIGWQTGRTGKITPVLRLETIEVDGANISNVTAHHAGNVRNLKRRARVQKSTSFDLGA